jgi:hypothetical protein
VLYLNSDCDHTVGRSGANPHSGGHLVTLLIRQVTDPFLSFDPFISRYQLISLPLFRWPWCPWLQPVLALYATQLKSQQWPSEGTHVPATAAGSQGAGGSGPHSQQQQEAGGVSSSMRTSGVNNSSRHSNQSGSVPAGTSGPTEEGVLRTDQGAQQGRTSSSSTQQPGGSISSTGHTQPPAQSTSSSSALQGHYTLSPYQCTGLVVDVGESGTNVVPVVNGFVVRSAVRSVPLGGCVLLFIHTLHAAGHAHGWHPPPRPRHLSCMAQCSPPVHCACLPAHTSPPAPLTAGMGSITMHLQPTHDCDMHTPLYGHSVDHTCTLCWKVHRWAGLPISLLPPLHTDCRRAGRDSGSPVSAT